MCHGRLGILHAAQPLMMAQEHTQWTWVGDDSVFKKYGEQLGLVGTWWSGQEHRVLSGSRGRTCSTSAIDPGVTALRSLGCVMYGCGR